MAGSILRLTIFVIFSSSINCSPLQNPVSFIQNPFDLMGILRKEIQARGAHMFTYSPTSSAINFSPPIRPVYSRMPRNFPRKPFTTSSYSSVVRKKPKRNFVEGRMKQTSNKYQRNILNNNIPVLMENSKTKNFSHIFKIPRKNESYTLVTIKNLTAEAYSKKQTYNSEYYNELNSKRKNSILVDNYHILKNTFPSSTAKMQYRKSHGSLDSSKASEKAQRRYTTKQNEIISHHKNKKHHANNSANVNKSHNISFDFKNHDHIYYNDPNFYKTHRGDKEEEKPKTSFLGYIISTLTQLPVIGNVLRASVDPLFRPIVGSLKADNGSLLRGENNMKNWCFDELGCIKPSIDFYHPLYRPVNLPPYTRTQIATKFTIYSQGNLEGKVIPAMDLEELFNSTFNPSRPTKIIIHGYLNYKGETWILEMVRSLLRHGDYNVITVDWSGGAYALYSQATANIRVVALEVSRLLTWLITNYGLNVSTVHIIGHSLGAHTAGYVGESIKGISRITGLDPAEPFFQYMPKTVRLDSSDANFVDVIHTDINPFFALTGPRGFGLEQPVGHVDFYPNGGKEQPGCNQLLARVPLTLMMEGRDLIEGMNAAHTELLNCDHVRSTKLFTDSLTSSCPYLGFACSSYNDYKEGKCFDCGPTGEFCAFMGINADTFHFGNRTNVKIFLDTHYAPNFCKYHYILTINFADPFISLGTLRGRLKISLIDEDGKLKKFDLTALTPIKFPRRGSRTFLLDHYEDLSGTHEALIKWVYESDILDPLSYCVLFCKADLSISSISLTSVDSSVAASELLRLHSRTYSEENIPFPMHRQEIVMCHKKGEKVVRIPSEDTIKISASPYCRSQNQLYLISNDNFSSKDSNFHLGESAPSIQDSDEKR